MRTLLQAIHITIEQARLAYPIIQCANRDLSLDVWLEHARRHAEIARDSGGLVGIVGPREVLHAVFTYRVVRDIRLGSVVRLCDLTIGALPGLKAADIVEIGVGLISNAVKIDAVAVETPVHNAALQSDTSLNPMLGKTIANVHLLAHDYPI